MLLVLLVLLILYLYFQVRLYYYQDEAGLVPEHTQLLTTASGDLVEPASPCWGLDITCEKATDFSYGPWADRQREMLYKFFFPPDYQVGWSNNFLQTFDKKNIAATGVDAPRTARAEKSGEKIRHQVQHSRRLHHRYSLLKTGEYFPKRLSIHSK